MATKPALKPLPDCPGPKLHPYNATGTTNIEFLSYLGEGMHALVYKVKIDWKIYALKVFLNQRMWHWITWSCKDWTAEDDRLLVQHVHPFYAECRAFGRLKEVGKEELAVRCFGYLELTKDQEEEAERLGGDGTWWKKYSGIGLDTSKPDMDMIPRRAILKEFVDSKVDFEPQQAQKMVSNLHGIHRCGMIVSDLKVDQYVGGILVDLSSAETVPYLVYEKELNNKEPAENRAKQRVHYDLGGLDGMFKDWNRKHPDSTPIRCRALSMMTMDMMYKLRNGKQRYYDRKKHLFDVLSFDWKNITPISTSDQQVHDLKPLKSTSKHSNAARDEMSNRIKKRQRTSSSRSLH